MKKTALKDALRNIWKQKVSWLSIIVIAFLGVTTFLGIDYSDGALRKNGSDMYNAVNFRDLELVSTLLMAPEDLYAILETEGVRDAEAVWQTSGKVSSGETRQDVAVITLTERINWTQLLEGRLPQTAAECAVEQRLAQEMGWLVGDTVSVRNAGGDRAEYLREESFIITGIANHPDHTSVSIPDTLYVMVRPEAFDLDALSGSFMKAEVIVERADAPDRFGADYEAATAAVSARLEETAAFCTARRDDDVRAHVQEQIDEGQRALDEASSQLEQARGELDAGWSALADGEQEAEEGEQQLAEGKAALDLAEDQLWSAQLQAKTAEKELADGREALVAGAAELEAVKAGIRNAIRAQIDQLLGPAASMFLPWATGGMPDVDDPNASVRSFPITEDYTVNLTWDQHAAAVALMNSGYIPDEMLLSAYRTLKPDAEDEPDMETVRAFLAERLGAVGSDYSELAEACRVWDEGHAKYIQGKAAYAKSAAALREGLNQWYIKREEYREGLKTLEEGRRVLQESREKLDEGERQYNEGYAAYEDGLSQFGQVRSQIGLLSPSHWIFLDCRGNSSFVQLALGSSNLTSLEMTFSMLFVLIGALVIYATISKMIDEQRSLVGTGKALGLYNREIFVKYLLFGLSATLLGTVLGILTARYAMEVYVLKSARPFYTFDTSKPTLLVRPTVIVLIATALLAITAIWFACTKLMRSTAIQLMQPKVPSGRRKSGAKRHLLPLYSRLILLNIRTDLRRVLVTVVSVAGCCALVVIGFTLKSGVEGALEKQYTQIVDYDGRVKFDTVTAADAAEEIEGALRDAGAAYTELYDGVVTFRVTENLVGELLCGDIAEISSFYHLRDWQTDEVLTPSDEGIFVQKRTAESYDLQVGSELELTLGGTKTVKVRVAGIFNNYIGRIMVMSGAYYTALTGENVRTNAFYLRLNGADEQTLLTSLRQIEGFESYTPSDADKSLFASSSVLVTAVVALFIFMAAVMAGIVLMNLTNIYIMQKKTELTIMRINGFTVGEVIGYVLREVIVTTVLGILCGLAMGSGIAYKITRAMESMFVQYDRSVNPLAWLWGAAITGLFAVIINAIVLRRVRDLKLTDLA